MGGGGAVDLLQVVGPGAEVIGLQVGRDGVVGNAGRSGLRQGGSTQELAEGFELIPGAMRCPTPYAREPYAFNA